jgi:hypothetical protein
MLLYAFQPGDNVQAFIFSDMVTTKADDSVLLDKDSLFKLLAAGNPKNRRKEDAETSQLPPGVTRNRRKSDAEKLQLPPGVPKNRRKGDSESSQLPSGVTKNRRKSDSNKSQLPPSVPKNRRKGDVKAPSTPAIEAVEAIVNFFSQNSKRPNYVISIESGPLQGERCFVTLPCIIGRSNCDLILNDRLISRRHAELKIVEDSLVIEDLASTNGTKVNGKMVTIKQLAPNDLISIGPVDLRISPA